MQSACVARGRARNVMHLGATRNASAAGKPPDHHRRLPVGTGTKGMRNAGRSGAGASSGSSALSLAMSMSRSCPAGMPGFGAVAAGRRRGAEATGGSGGTRGAPGSDSSAVRSQRQTCAAVRLLRRRPRGQRLGRWRPQLVRIQHVVSFTPRLSRRGVVANVRSCRCRPRPAPPDLAARERVDAAPAARATW